MIQCRPLTLQLNCLPIRRRVFVFTCLLVIVYHSNNASSPTAFAQIQTANLSGTVEDERGAVIPHARVIALNTSKGLKRETTTNENGYFIIPLLSPGAYVVRAEATSFVPAEVHDVILNVGDQKILEIQVRAGDLQATITVINNPVSINTESSTIGEVINNQAVENMPLNGREFLGLAGLIPGSQTGNNKRGAVASKGINVGFNGARSNYNAYYVDGADSTDPTRNQLISSPSLDSVKEFRVDTSLFPARYGRAGGAIINVVTKSGTNNFHGSLYNYHRNKWLDAAPVFDQRPYELRSPYLFNQFGGSIGGPFTFPIFGEGGPTLKSFKDRLFFFVSAEGFRQKKSGQLTESFAPTTRERAGDFSQSINPFTGQRVVLKNPFTGEVIPSSIIPSELINPVGRRLMDELPQPNFSGDPILNLRQFRNGMYRQKKWLGRIDYNLSSKSALSFIYNSSDYDNVLVADTIYGDKNALEHDHTMVMSYTQTLTSTLVNDLKFNYTIFDIGQQFLLNDKNYAKEFGLWTGTALNPHLTGSPRILLYTAGYRVFQIGSSGANVNHNRHAYLKDDLVSAKGRHTISLGGDLKRQFYDWLITDSVFGSYYFGILDGDPAYESIYGATGSAFSSLLMGVSALTYYDTSNGEPSKLRRNTIGLYIQDDWRFSPRLTFNVGVRYDYEAPFSAADNKFLTLNFQTGMPRYAKGAPADRLSLLKFKYESDGPNRPYEPSTMNFAPRLGLAFRLSTKGVLRGGYGISYTSENAYTTTYGAWVVPFSGTFAYYSKAPYWPDHQDHLVPIDREPYNYYSQAGTDPGTFLPTTPEYPAGYVQQWNLSIAREVGQNTAVEAAYVGSRGVNLNGVEALRNYSPALDTLVKKNVPGWPGIGLRTKGFNSKYHALELKAVRRLSSGFDFLASFTWSHAIAEASNDDVNENNFADINQWGDLFLRNWSNADFDVRKRFTVSSNYDLPFGNGRSFGTNWNSFTNAVLGGWRLALIIALQDGRPWSVRTASNNIPDRVCDGNLPSKERTVSRWFNPACFPSHPSQTYTDANGITRPINTQGNSGANVILGPGFKTVDLGLHKDFHITEDARVQLRLESFNLLNHPNFIGPSGNNFVNTPAGGRITRAYDNRDIQIAIKFLF